MSYDLATMNLYQPLLVGSAPVEMGGDITWACWPNYRRQSLAMGGDHLATFSFTADDSILERWLDNYLACHFVETWGGITTFMGMVWTMRLSYHGVVITRSLDTMFNDVRVRYKTDSAAAETTTSAATDADSIARYGTKQLLEEVTNVYMPAATAEGYRDGLLSQYSFPRAIQQEARLAGNAQQGTLQVEVRGYVHSMNNNLFNDAGASDTGISTQIANMVSVSDYVLDGNYEGNTDDASEESDYQPVWDRIHKLTKISAPNSGYRWLSGCYQGRNFDYFQAVIETIAYEQELRSQRRLMFLPGTGEIIPPPLIQPGGVVFIRDIMGGRPQEATLLDDPRAMFVDMVEYSVDGVVLKGNPRDEGQKAAALALALRTKPNNGQRIDPPIFSPGLPGQRTPPGQRGRPTRPAR